MTECKWTTINKQAVCLWPANEQLAQKVCFQLTDAAETQTNDSICGTPRNKPLQ